jgi:hypothetical protein
MKEAGCESMCYGIDSGSSRTLRFIRKSIDHSILYQRVRETTDRGIVPTLSFVIGFPEEEKEDIDATLTLALKTGALGNNNPLIQMATVLPGTDLCRRYAECLVREVDTYFSLGLEFDNSKRLSSDEELIDSNPAVFSSFYNLPSPAHSLKKLHTIAEFFPIIVNFFPRSFLLLSMECGISASDLFFDFLAHLAAQIGRKGLSLSPPECFRHFGAFASELLSKRKTLSIPHLPDVIRYETKAVEAGKFGHIRGCFSVDMSGLAGFRPMRSEKIVTEEFTFPMADIIFDLKAGVFHGAYPPTKTYLVFTQEKDQLNVREINEFGKNLLDLCDGERTLESISLELFGRFGQQTSLPEFREVCVEAVLSLGRMNMLRFEQPENDQERR